MKNCYISDVWQIQKLFNETPYLLLNQKFLNYFLRIKINDFQVNKLNILYIEKLYLDLKNVVKNYKIEAPTKELEI